MKYRIIAKPSLYNWILLQERKWYGWHTIADFIYEYDGLEKAIKLRDELIKLNQPTTKGE